MPFKDIVVHQTKSTILELYILHDDYTRFFRGFFARLN